MKFTLFISSVFIILLPCIAAVNPQPGSDFVSALLKDDSNLSHYVYSEEFARANRLGISYEDVRNKFLISYDIDETIKTALREKSKKYTLSCEPLTDNFTRATINVADPNYAKTFYFKDTMLVSPIYYYTGNWQNLQSEFFSFYISDTTLFNRYTMNRLDDFVRESCALLQIDNNRLDELRRAKIFYFLCRDEQEIEKVTGFNTRGLYILAFDYVVTTFNCHYHELLHLLINYKMQNLPLYTQPFLQEGFAVAFGGRGGTEPQVQRELGLFLVQSGMLDYTGLLTSEEFFQNDNSLSYPVAGLYNYFLLNEIGIDEYLKLYRKYSGSAEQVKGFRIDMSELPPLHKWQTFLNKFSRNKLVNINAENAIAKPIFSNASGQIYQVNNDYYFQVKEHLLFGPILYHENYKSKLLCQLFPDMEYHGEQCFIKVNPDEIGIYNLYTNNLVANYVASFSIPYAQVPQHEGFINFSVKQKVFDELLIK